MTNDGSRVCVALLQALLGILNVIANDNFLSLYLAENGGVRIVADVLKSHLHRPRVQVVSLPLPRP